MRREAARALAEYGLLVIPGLELSDNDDDPNLSAHVLALGLERHIPVDGGILRALEEANELGAALVAAHPYAPADVTSLSPTRRIARSSRPSARSSTATSCSTVTRSSAGWPRPGYRRSRRETSTARRGLAAACRCASIGAALMAVGVHSPATAGIVGLVGLELSTLIPLAPGLAGVGRAAVAIAVAAHGVPSATAFAGGVAFYVAEGAAGVAFGLATTVAFIVTGGTSWRRPAVDGDVPMPVW